MRPSHPSRRVRRRNRRLVLNWDHVLGVPRTAATEQVSTPAHIEEVALSEESWLTSRADAQAHVELAPIEEPHIVEVA